uniref:FEZ family zinc finger 2 n=1 Tax=Sphenodon punctatus TaxID=8508 RepID=A0A8D0H5I0_SPHPU
MASSASLETVMPSSPCPRTGASKPSKTLAFSIERIMAKTSEPKPAALEPRPAGLESEAGKKMLSLCSPIPCVIPIQPLGYEVPAKTLLNYSELWKSSLRSSVCASAGLCKANCGMCCKGELGLGHSAGLPTSRVIKPQVINQAVGMPANGSLYYFNYLDSSYHPSEILHGQLFPSGILNAQSPAALSAHQKLFLLENAKLASLATEKFPNPQYPHKERLPGQLDQVMKENTALTGERNGVKTHSKLSGGGGSADGKTKNFTCEVCGKVRWAMYLALYKGMARQGTWFIPWTHKSLLLWRRPIVARFCYWDLLFII